MIPFILNEATVANTKFFEQKDFAAAEVVCRVNPISFEVESIFDDPGRLEKLLESSSNSESSRDSHDFSDMPDWTKQLEARFRRLAEDKAIKNLSFKGKIEFEKLMALRRQLKNPRTGEEVLTEYRQRMLTRNLVTALTQYVSFHKTAHNSR